MNICPICGRELIPGPSIDRHHLLPKTRGNRDKRAYEDENLIIIHKVCHSKIHHTFSENDLFSHYHTIESIVNHPEIQKFINWVAKKEPEFYDGNKDTKNRKRKR